MGIRFKEHCFVEQEFVIVFPNKSQDFPKNRIFVNFSTFSMQKKMQFVTNEYYRQRSLVNPLANIFQQSKWAFFPRFLIFRTFYNSPRIRGHFSKFSKASKKFNFHYPPHFNSSRFRNTIQNSIVFHFFPVSNNFLKLFFYHPLIKFFK